MIEVIGKTEDGKPVVVAESPSVKDIPWEKMSIDCSCGCNTAKFYIVNGDYKKICSKCGLISLYSGEVVHGPEYKPWFGLTAEQLAEKINQSQVRK